MKSMTNLRLEEINIVSGGVGVDNFFCLAVVATVIGISILTVKFVGEYVMRQNLPS